MKNGITALLAGIVLLLFSSLLAQAPDTLWTRTFGGDSADIGSSVQQTLDGGYIAVGGTGSFGNGKTDAYLIKMDMNGYFLWSKTYGGLAADWGSAVQQTLDGGYIIAGGTSSFGGGLNDVLLIKTDSSGDTIWTKTYGGEGFDFSRSVDATSDGGYIIAGATTSFGAGWYDAYLVKTDSLGNLLWSKTFGGVDEDIAFSVQQTFDNGYIIGGYTDYGSGNSSVYLVKTDSFGDTMWTKKYGGPNCDQGYSSIITSDNGYIIVGETSSFGPGGSNVYVVKTDELGDTMWTAVYGGNEIEQGYSVCEITNSGYAIAGYTDSYGSGNGDFYLLRTNEDGDTLWTKTFGGNQWEYALSIQSSSDGGYIITGYTESYGEGNGDVYLVKTTEDPVNEERSQKIPSQSLKLTASPNPFSVSTNIQLQGSNRATVSIYDALGRRVREISLLPFNFRLGATWDGRDKAGKALPPGIYFLKLNSKPVGKVVKVR